MAWLLLIGAGLLEIVWAVALKRADGLTRLWPAAAAVVAAAVSFAMLAHSLKSLPVGTAYAVWVGIGAFGVAIVGIAVLGENTSWMRMLSLALIVLGVIGLKLSDG